MIDEKISDEGLPEPMDIEINIPPEENKKIKSRLNMMVFVNYVKLLLIVAPIVLAIIYLPAIIEQYTAQIQNIFGTAPGNMNLGNILREGFGLDSVSNLTAEQLEQVKGMINK